MSEREASVSARSLKLASTPTIAVVNQDTIAHEVNELWNSFHSNRTVDLRWRRDQLQGVRTFLKQNREQILSALQSDLGKPAFEAYAADIGAVLAEAQLLSDRLPKLMQPRKVPTPLLNMPATSWIYPEPVGPALVLPAWNYPFGLALLPVIGALAAGNPVALKPSEMAPQSAELLVEELPRHLDGESVRVFSGGPECAQALLQQNFGHIHYTGSAAIGRLVMSAAAEHLTPVTLELGGKNPAYVHSSANIAVAARRILWGRMMNAGQVCLSPDYVLVDSAVESQFLDAIEQAARSMYGPDPRTSKDFARIVNDRHFDRISALMQGAGDIVFGGETHRSTRYIAPTVLSHVDDGHPIMREEIFGPVLPVRSVSNLSDAIEFVRTLPTPLAFYVFADDKNAAERAVAETSSGSAVVNHVFVHGFNHNLPFGGVGNSGMGRYTGLSSFDCFSNMKSVMKTHSFPDIAALFPPYRGWKLRLVSRILK